MKRLFWFLLGAALGFGLALLIGWVLVPVERSDASPVTLRRDYKDDYIRLVAVAYQGDGDLPLAQERLMALEEASPAAPLVELTERYIQQDKPDWLLLPLVALARDLNAITPSMTPYLRRGAP